MRKWLVGLSIFAVGGIGLLLVIGMFTPDNYRDEPAGSATAPVTPTPDARVGQRNASAAIACRDFRRTMSDLSKDILTTPELRKELQSVYRNARLATLDDSSRMPPAGFSESAEEMLRLVTGTSDVNAFTTAVGKFSDGCREQQF